MFGRCYTLWITYLMALLFLRLVGVAGSCLYGYFICEGHSGSLIRDTPSILYGGVRDRSEPIKPSDKSPCLKK